MEFIATDRRRVRRKAERRRSKEIVEVKEEKRREKNVFTYTYDVVRKTSATIVIIMLHLLKT